MPQSEHFDLVILGSGYYGDVKSPNAAIIALLVVSGRPQAMTEYLDN